MARRRVIQGIRPGGHDVSVLEAGMPTRRISPPDLLIAHVAFTTANRFARKVENIRAELTRNPDCYSGELAWHWKRWLTMAERGLIEEEFARQVLDDEGLALMRQGGFLRSAAELFVEQELHPSPRVHGLI